MLTYLIIILDDTSVSYCHYKVDRKKQRLISLENLKAGITFAMKENLNIQFVYPDYELPKAYKEMVESIDHTKIGPVGCGENLDMIITESLDFIPNNSKRYLWRCSLELLASSKETVANILPKISRLNVVLTDIPTWKKNDFDIYRETLEWLAANIAEDYQRGISVQLNLLTDRFMLDKMNNCNAGDASITLAPDGCFYICPAYYPLSNVGSLKQGLKIPNQQLYRLDHAPICRKCDAFQCKRCIWMNEQITLDCNTPSHEQCVAAHLERNASRTLLQILESKHISLEDCYGIEEIDYLDPFNILNKWN